jgi:hypothetical protein
LDFAAAADVATVVELAAPAVVVFAVAAGIVVAVARMLVGKSE